MSVFGAYSVWMRENAEQNNSEYGHFSRSVVLLKGRKKLQINLNYSHQTNANKVNPLSTNPTKWSNTWSKMVLRIVWVCLTILWSWSLKVNLNYSHKTNNKKIFMSKSHRPANDKHTKRTSDSQSLPLFLVIRTCD